MSRSAAMRSAKFTLAAASLLALCASALAGSFKVPYDKPSLAVTVPDKWTPNSSEDGVDAAAPGGAFFMSIYTFAGEDCKAAREDVVAFLTRNGMKIDAASARDVAQAVPGLHATGTQYAATEDGKTRQVIAVVAPLPRKRCLQIAQWGTEQGFRQNADAMTKIVGSIKLLDK
jgi:hypothetical protein